MKYRLTETKVKNLKPTPGKKVEKIADGGGLYLLLTAQSAKHWRYKYRLGGVERVHTLGTYPAVSLAQARAEHLKARALVATSIHPGHSRKLDDLKKVHEGADTFRGIAEEWFKEQMGDRTAYYRSQIRRALNCEIYPAIGKLPVRSVTPAHALAIVDKKMKDGKAVTADNSRRVMSQVFRYGILRLRCDTDPAAALKGVVKRPPVTHNRALSEAEIADLLVRLEEHGGTRATKIAIELLLLTFVRTVELRKATWEEIDIDAAVWKIPKERMKMGLEHHVPLCDRAIVLLRELKAVTGDPVRLFPNNRRPDDFMTPTTINRALERMGLCGKGSIGFSAHGFRGTASTLLHEREFMPEVIERQLAHVSRNKVASAYNKAAYWPQRVEMMNKWAISIEKLRDAD